MVEILREDYALNRREEKKKKLRQLFLILNSKEKLVRCYSRSIEWFVSEHHHQAFKIILPDALSNSLTHTKGRTAFQGENRYRSFSAKPFCLIKSSRESLKVEHQLLCQLFVDIKWTKWFNWWAWDVSITRQHFYWVNKRKNLIRFERQLSWDLLIS